MSKHYILKEDTELKYEMIKILMWDDVAYVLHINIQKSLRDNP